MLDRYDPRDTRERDGSWDRSRCSRGVACERDRNEGQDPHDVLMKDLDLPRGRQREVVRERERVYEINRAESRMLATVGAFRAVARLEGGKTFDPKTEAADTLSAEAASRDPRRPKFQESFKIPPNRASPPAKTHQGIRYKSLTACGKAEPLPATWGTSQPPWTRGDENSSQDIR